MGMTTSDEAKITPRQHIAPCGDCPWRRKSIPGWLGGLTADEWLREAHSEARIDCHTTQWECAGAAIYRANVLKELRDKDRLSLPKDRTRVFATPTEFKTYHQGR